MQVSVSPCVMQERDQTEAGGGPTGGGRGGRGLAQDGQVAEWGVGMAWRKEKGRLGSLESLARDR